MLFFVIDPHCQSRLIPRHRLHCDVNDKTRKHPMSGKEVPEDEGRESRDVYLRKWQTDRTNFFEDDDE
ncbi:uncharacterized protein J3R85_015537 [Psidium guajava]|nr:uncharacterized protein J3R85_015537 [Psidium guajava]